MDFKINKILKKLQTPTIFEYEAIDRSVIACFGNILYGGSGVITYSNDYGLTWTTLACPLFTTMHITTDYVVYGFIKEGATTKLYKSTNFTTFTVVPALFWNGFCFGVFLFKSAAHCKAYLTYKFYD